MNYAVEYIIEKSFKSLGLGCRISPLAVIMHPENIEIGDNVIIDEFTILDGGSGLKIGSHIHIPNHCNLRAGSGIEIGDFCNLGAYCAIYSESDDGNGYSLIGPQFKMKFKPRYKSAPVIMEKHSSLGMRTTLMPGVRLAEGVYVGAHSLVLKSITQEYTTWVGSPAKYLKPRSRKMVEISEAFLDEFRNGPREDRGIIDEF